MLGVILQRNSGRCDKVNQQHLVFIDLLCYNDSNVAIVIENLTGFILKCANRNY